MSIIKESWTNLKRHNLLSIATIISLSLILVLFNVLISVHLQTTNVINELSDKINYTLYLDANTPQDTITEVQQFLDKQPEIINTEFISQDSSIQKLQDKYPNSTEFIQRYELKNPLPNSFKVTTQELEQHATLRQKLESSDFSQYIVKSKLRQDHAVTLNKIVNNFINIKNLSLKAFLGIIIIFVFAGALITFNAIKTSIYNRKNEIQIMQFVGATFDRVRAPFLIESLMIGLFSFLLNLILLIPINQIFITSFGTSENIQILSLQLLISLILSLATSLLLVNKYLKTKEIYQN